MRRCALSVLIAAVVVPTVAFAQTDQQVTVFEHPAEQRFYVAGQMNFIYQQHGDFPARYSGPQSFKPVEEDALSRVLTLYTGVRLPDGWDVVLDIESAGGLGLSDAFGL